MFADVISASVFATVSNVGRLDQGHAARPRRLQASIPSIPILCEDEASKPAYGGVKNLDAINLKDRGDVEANVWK